MILLDRVSITVAVHGHRTSVYTPQRSVLSFASLTIPSDRRIALFGQAPECRMLTNLLSGLSVPASGLVIRKAKVSFPVGYLGSFNPDLPVRHNVAHVARLYDTDAEKMVKFIEQVGRLGKAFDKPYGELPLVMKARLGYIIAYTIPFDLYMLSDGGVRAALNPRDILHALFRERLRTSGMIISTRNPNIALEYCDMAMILKDGKLSLYDSVEQALSALHSPRTRAAGVKRLSAPGKL